MRLIGQLVWPAGCENRATSPSPGRRTLALAGLPVAGSDVAELSYVGRSNTADGGSGAASSRPAIRTVVQFAGTATAVVIVTRGAPFAKETELAAGESARTETVSSVATRSTAAGRETVWHMAGEAAGTIDSVTSTTRQKSRCLQKHMREKTSLLCIGKNWDAD